MKNKLIRIKNRIYTDYIMPSRLNEYEEVIKRLNKDGYIHITLREYKELLDNHDIKSKYFVNRHDIDTDIATAKKFFEIEKKYGVKATYYFRLSTLDINFMKEIEEYGSEASYHFEEIAQFAKDNHIKSKQELFDRIYDIKEIFKLNFKMIEKKTGLKLKTVCSHGDFANRKLSIINNELTKDKSLRKELGILCETYDKDILESIDVYLSDGKFSIDASAEDILSTAINSNIIYMLTHPRQWRTSIFCNTKENIKRIYEALKW